MAMNLRLACSATRAAGAALEARESNRRVQLFALRAFIRHANLITSFPLEWQNVEKLLRARGAGCVPDPQES